jgi:hypothetical protein
MSGTIKINESELHYRSYAFMGNEYIVSYLTDYGPPVKERLRDIARIVYNCKENIIIPYNTLSECNKVAERLAIRMNFNQSDTSVIIGRNVSRGKIIMRGDNIPYNEDDVYEIYGSQLGITGVAFHALAYVTFHLSNYGEVHIAIDASSTSHVDKYFVNMLVATSIEELEQLAKIRYQYEKFGLVGIFDHPEFCK